MPPCRKPRRRQGTQRYGNALLALMSRTRFTSVPTLEAEQEKSKRRLSYTCPTAGVNELPKRKDIERQRFLWQPNDQRGRIPTKSPATSPLPNLKRPTGH